MLPELVPLLSQILSHDDWTRQESGILALGAIAEGCLGGMTEHLPQLMPFLFDCLRHEHALVRSITCWSISRYSAWIISSGPELLYNVVEALLERIMDGSKRVQVAACTAFSFLEEVCVWVGKAGWTWRCRPRQRGRGGSRVGVLR